MHFASEMAPSIDSVRVTQYASKISEHISANGLKSLHWVSGTHTPSLMPTVLEILASKQLRSGSLDYQHNQFCILVRPEERGLTEGLLGDSGCTVGCMEEYCTDSFLVINRDAVLDVAEGLPQEPVAELNTDTTLVSLYMGLFSLLENRAIIISSSHR